jgi:hypothetical protein
LAYPGPSLILTETVKFHLEVLRPLKLGSSDALQGFNIAVEEEFGQLLLAVGAMFEFSLCDSGGFSKVSVPIEDLVDFVFDFSLQVEFFQKFGNRFLYFMSRSLTVSNDCLSVLSVRLDQFVLQRFLYLPENVAVAHVLENEFALLSARQSHVLLQIVSVPSCAAIALLKGVVHCFAQVIKFLNVLTSVVITGSWSRRQKRLEAQDDSGHPRRLGEGEVSLRVSGGGRRL